MTTKKPLSVVTSIGGPTGIDPPASLGEYGRALWNKITATYRIVDPGGVELLTQACHASERAEKLRQRIDAEGEIIPTAQGIKDHPALKHELANRAFVVRTLIHLGINMEPKRSNGRPSGQYAGISFEDLP